ncbi:hypothetical protein [Chitinilyticum litopenaei]|uniref:hypothetical protein n=1 Tax=Chitinilyticum litopenaei TaxID=1121276 RepID=UPI000418E201|nr:hypothetical protein [Chitinilyticum litopenaei]
MVSHALGKRTPVWQGSQQLDRENQLLLTQLQDLVDTAPRGKLGQDSVHFVLGAPLVRHTMLSWQDNLRTLDDWKGYASVLFAQQYGVDISQWRIQIAEEGYGRPRLAIAMDELLYQTILDVVRNARLRLQGVEPLLAQVVNRHFRQLKHTEYALLILERQFAHVGFWRDRQWQSVSCQPFQAGSTLKREQLSALLRDTAILTGQPLPAEAYLSAVDIDASDVDVHADGLIWLGAPLPQFASPEPLA